MISKKVRRQKDKQKDKEKEKVVGRRELWCDCIFMEAGLGNNHYKIMWVPHVELIGI